MAKSGRFADVVFFLFRLKIYVFSGGPFYISNIQDKMQYYLN